MIRTVLFDLDGTLADTAPDLAFALNEVLVEEGRAALPFATIRPAVSHGSRALIELGFGLTPADAGYPALQRRVIEVYRANLTRATRLFAGMEGLLERIEGRGLNWGVVTNKPGYLTEPLMAQLGLDRRAACIVSGDTTANAKPHPEPMLYACRQAGSPAGECLYVGDARRDIEAGRNAGMTTLVALFGYLGEADRPNEWGADGMVAEPPEIEGWL